MRLIAITADQIANEDRARDFVMNFEANSEISEFFSENDAISHFRDTENLNLLLVNLRSPHLDGAAVIARIRAQAWGEGIPIIVISGRQDREMRLNVLRAETTDFLHSPVDPEEFLIRARNLITLVACRNEARRSTDALEREKKANHRARDELLRASHERLLQVIDTAPIMISAVDAEGRYVLVNRRHAEMVGAPASALMGTIARSWGDDEQRSEQQARLVIETGRAGPHYEETFVDAEGVERTLMTTKAPLHLTPPGESSSKPLVLITSLDITKRKAAERELHVLAYYDQITRLPNRLKLEIDLLRLNRKNQHQSFALYAVDLDRFKAINETLGHQAGDGLLRAVAERLVATLPAAIVSHIGGDRFAIVSPLDIGASRDAVEHKAKQILSAFNEPFELAVSHPEREEPGTVLSTCSLGVVIYRGGALRFETLLKRADMAMYRAKARGGRGYAFFQHNMEDAQAASMRIELDLHSAVRRNELRLHYQPEFDLKSGKIFAVEALLRWERRDGTLLSPGYFLTVAEETGLIAPITAWVLDEVCRQIGVWRAQGLTPRVAVNISGVLFRLADVHQMVTSAIEKSGVDPASLELELTESVLIENVDSTNRQLAALRDLGVSIAVDDFGTGYASLSYLTKFAVDRIKIDASFLRQIEESTNDQFVVRSILSLCRNLRLKVLAEGIERGEQALWLARHGCREGQGFYFARPRSAEDITNLLNAPAMQPPRIITRILTTERTEHERTLRTAES
ncbi:EAL domain-containing protein [Acetobacter sacchari]|uniref:EAL domain-containing protein n=1 Tax=Acetobacter sacchari TaxID=2661687 RepID=A0ABS3LR17_9PROT|nr:EAL domain-containing protein [Acetobacter sacchari]MBO1358362.1 EAL domain-containing protein [Acetobacter sacchari]